MLDGLFVTPVVSAIREALSALPSGKLAVIGDAKLAIALAPGREIVAVAVPERATKKLGELAQLGSLDGSLADGTFAGVVGVGLATDPEWQATLATWARVVCDRGLVVSVDRGHAHEASRRALCGGLTEIEQRQAARSVVTSGTVTR